MRYSENRCRLGAFMSSLAIGGAISWSGISVHAGSIQLLPARPEFAQAIDLLGKGKLAEADAMFRHVTEDNPEQLDASLARAQIAITEQRLDQADRMVSDVLLRRDTLPEAHNMKGLVLLLQKHPEEARAEFRSAIELRPRYVTPRLYLAVLARLSGDYTGAANEYKRITEVAPKLPAGYLGQAESQMLLHHQAEALRILESWKTADPRNLLPYRVLANVYLVSRQPLEAIAQLQAALAKSPHDSATLTVLGTAYSATGNTPLAMSQYEAALASDGANSDAALRLGELEAGKGLTERALAHFREVLKADPTNPVACNNIAWLLAGQGKHLDEALRLAELAVKHDPKYVDARDTLGWVRYIRGEYGMAVSALKEASALAPSRKDIAAHLSLASAKAERRQSLTEEFMKRQWLWLIVATLAVAAAVAILRVSKDRRAPATRGAPSEIPEPQIRG